MPGTIYWTFLAAATALLAYLSGFTLAPLVFLGGGGLLFAGYLILVSRNKGTAGWDPLAYRSRFVGSLIFYIAFFWIVAQLGKTRESREFWARPEPYVESGATKGYTFYYSDYAGSWERIDSPELNAFIKEKHPERVRMVLEVVKDFGKLRAYSVQSVESITVNSAWLDGMPPWSALRQP